MREEKRTYSKFGGIKIELIGDMLNATQIINYYNDRAPKKKSVRVYLNNASVSNHIAKLSGYTRDDLIIVEDGHRPNTYLHKAMFTHFIEWLKDPQMTKWAMDFASRNINLPTSTSHRTMLNAIKKLDNPPISMFWEETESIKKIHSEAGHKDDLDYLGLLDDLYKLNAHYIGLGLLYEDRVVLLGNYVYGFWVIKDY